jgi:general secretion pathway protein M
MQKGSLLSRLAALLLLLVCLTLVWILAIDPVLREHRRLDTAIADTALQYQRLAARRADLKQLGARLDTLRQDQSSQGEYLPEATASLAGASLLGMIKTMIQESDGTLTSSQIMQETGDGSLPSVTVHARMNVSTPALQQILHRLETAKPYLFLDHLAVSKQARRRVVRHKDKDKVQQPPEDIMLDVEFDVTGYLEQRAEG